MDKQQETLRASSKIATQEEYKQLPASQEKSLQVNGKKSFLDDWNNIADGCEVASIVVIGLGINLLTGQLDNMGCCTPTIERSAGLLGSLLITLSGVKFLYSKWQITKIVDAFQGDIYRAWQELDNSPQKARQIRVSITYSAYMLLIGTIVYLMRRI